MIERADGLVELIDDYFFEIVDTGLIKLENDDAFKIIQNEKMELFSKYPNLKQVIQHEKQVDLCGEDIDGLKKLLAINHSISMLEMQYCYYKGMKDYYELLKTIGNK